MTARLQHADLPAQPPSVAHCLLTDAHYRQPLLPPSDTPPEVLAVLWRVQDDFLATALARIDAEPGGLDGFLRRRMGLDEAARQRLAAH